MSCKAVAIVAAVAAFWALGFLWIGTTHRDRCIKAGNVGCSILPWSGTDGGGGWGMFGR